jgi:hypothetical protein
MVQVEITYDPVTENAVSLTIYRPKSKRSYSTKHVMRVLKATIKDTALYMSERFTKDGSAALIIVH